MRLNRRGFLQAGAAGAAGAALLPPPAATARVRRPRQHERAAAHHRQPAAGPCRRLRVAQVRTPNIDALAARGCASRAPSPRRWSRCRRAARSSPAGGSSRTATGRRTRRSGRAPAGCRSTTSKHTFTSGARDAGYWIGADQRQPVPRLHEGLRAVPRELPPLEDDRGPVRLHASRPRTCRSRRQPLAADLPARRALHAPACASTSPTRARAATRRRPAPRASSRGDATCSTSAPPPAFALTIDCFDPHEPWSPPRKYIDMYGDPTYEGPEVGVTHYGLARLLPTPRAARG